MKNWRRWLSAALACIMTVMSFGALPVFAAEPTVVYSDNFDSLAEGAKPSGVQVVENATKMLYARGEKEGNNGVLHIYAHEDGEAGGPRITVKFDASALPDLTITYKGKNAGSNAGVAFATDGGKNGMISNVGYATAKDWQEVKVEINFEKMTYTTTVGGKQTGKDKPLHTPNDMSTAELRFSAGAPKPGEGAYFDDIVVTTTSTVSANAGTTTPSASANEPGVKPDTAPTKISVPGGAYAFIDTDFTGVKLGAATKANLFSGGTGYADIVDIGTNRLLRFWASDNAKHWPRVELSLQNEVDTYVFEADVFIGGSPSVYANLFTDGAANNDIVSLKANSEGMTAGWNHVKIEVDLGKETATATVNGQKKDAVAMKPISDRNSVSFRLNATLSNVNDVIYVDNMQMYTTEDYKYEGILKGVNDVEWANVLPTNPLSANSYVNNLRAHPRIFVKDWAQMRETINSSYEAKMWYNNLKIAADGYLTTKATYNVNSRGNILESARAAEGRLQTLAFVYNITGDRKYFDKAYAEMIEYGTWPDWSGFISSLVTAEIMFGYACAYDWLYYDLTPAQRNEIRAIVKKLALPDMIYNYEGKKTSTNFTTSTINWNPVCNACMIGTAFAFADEEPNLSEYILERAPEFITHSLSPYAPEGGYPEGTMYWDYGTTFLCFAMDMLEYGFKQGFVLPEKYKYYTYPGVAETCDFPIYYNSSVGKFDYGDASGGGVSSEVFYWMADRFNKPQYAWFENKAQFDRGSYLNGYSAIFALACYDKDNATVAPGVFSLDKFYSSEEDVNGITMRSSWAGDQELYAAMQGGNNAENHMHWSLGTYVIDYHKKRFVDEDIATDYALKGSKETIYYKRAEAHNTLVINPSAAPDQEQKSVAKVIKSGTSDNTAFGILDMTATNKDFTEAKRGMMMTDNRNRVIIQDEVKANKPSEFYWFANTGAGVKIAADGKSVILNRDGEEMLVRIIEGPAEAKFTVMERKSLIDGVKNTQDGIKLAIHIPSVTELNLAVEYVGLEKGEGIPAPLAYVPLEQWTANDNGMTAVASAGTATVLKLNTPNAIAKGEKTYVDSANYDVVPFTENGRTLVPVRFISESFGAKVGWDDATQAVTVQYKDKNISLQIGSNIMYVGDKIVTLDVPANTYNSRTLIPLRALVEALGKHVFWDDRGLIIIADDATPYSAETIDALIKELNVRVTVNGSDMTFFELDRENYVLNVKSGEAVPTIGVSTIGGEAVSVTQAAAIGEAATVTVDGKTYTIKIEKDPFEGILGSKDPGVINDVLVTSVRSSALPAYDTFIYVEDLSDSTGWATYPKRGIVDGVINEAIANRWASQGEGWIQMDFGSVKNLHSMAFAGVNQTTRAYKFDVEVSTDGQNWTKVHEGGAPTTNDVMSIIPLGDVQARYVKLAGHGNNINAWNTWAEVRYYESEAQQSEDKSLWNVYFAKSGICGKAGTSAKLSVQGVDANRDEFDLRADAVITYAVADPSIATVSEDGIVTFIKVGKTTIRVTATQDGFTAEAEVAVETE